MTRETAEQGLSQKPREGRATGANAVMTLEDRLCLLLARGSLTAEEQSLVRELIARGPQWPLLLERSYRHQVFPLLYRNLLDLGFPGVPESVQTDLKAAFLANALRSQTLAEELGRLLGILGEAGIRAVPLKGVSLAQSLYNDTAARVCGDIDLMVPQASLAQAIKLILDSGYRTETGNAYFARLALRHDRHFNMVREGRGISLLLELHWMLIQYSARDADAVSDLWSEAVAGEFFGALGFSLSPEWEMLYLSIHAAHHEWQCLKWLVDIHLLASSEPVNWPLVMKKAEQFEIDGVVRQTLAVCSFLLGTAIPECCRPATLPEGVELFADVPFPAGAPESAVAFRHMRLLNRPADKARYLATVFFAPKATDLEFLRIPRPFGFLYYFLRPVRLTGKWAGRAVSRILGKS